MKSPSWSLQIWALIIPELTHRRRCRTAQFSSEQVERDRNRRTGGCRVGIGSPGATRAKKPGGKETSELLSVNLDPMGCRVKQKPEPPH